MISLTKFITEIADELDNTLQPKDILRNPSLLYASSAEALAEAKKISVTKNSPGDRVYILKYRDYAKVGIKPYVVIYNKTLLSQAPNWQSRGYRIIGWVSESDGVVVQNDNGEYVKAI